jgi:predicted Zn-dependent peptidase
VLQDIIGFKMKNKLQRKVLKNGMTILFEKRDLPIVSVAFAVRNGGINESLDEKGISHFIEHLLYKGTPTRNSKQISESIEKNGGELNGFTSEEITAYWCKMPSKHLDLALEVLSDMVKNPLFDEKEMEKERKVTFEEMKMIHDTPMRYALDEIQKYLYKGTLSFTNIGTIKTMNSIDRKKILKKFNEIYQPNNMILCVIGEADFGKICKFVEANFSNEKGKVPEQKIEKIIDSKVEERKGIDQAHLVFAYHVPFSDDKKSYSAKILSVLMAEGMSSRLFSEIREKRNLAYSIKGGSDINKRFAYNLIYVGTTKENIRVVEKLILEEFEKVSKSLTENDLNQIKTQLIGQYDLGMEDSQSQMVNLLASEIQTSAEDFYKFEENVSKVKLADVKELAGKVKKGNYSFFALVPKN